MAWLRRGGRGALADGGRLTWSVAEGGRGTRWREVAARGEAITRSILIEVAPDGHPTRLEIATAAGLLTLHPEPDRSALHGNVVTRDGIRHLTFDWSADHALLVAASPVAAAILVQTLGQRGHETGATATGHGVVVDDALDPRVVAWTADSLAADHWSLHWDGAAIDLQIDASGLPVLDDAQSWPLER